MAADSEQIADILCSIAEVLGGQQRIENVLIDIQMDLAAVREDLPQKSIPLQLSERSSNIVREANDASLRRCDSHNSICPPRHQRPRLGAAYVAPLATRKDVALEAATMTAQIQYHTQQGGYRRADSMGLGSVRGDDADWPACVEIHDCLRATGTDAPDISVARRMSNQAGMTGIWALPSVDSVSRWAGSVVIDPDSVFLLPVKGLVILALVHDLIVIPFTLAWPDSWVEFDVALSQVALSVWLLDMVLTFFTGYYLDGELEQRLPRIAKRYARSWLVPDLVALLCEVVSVAHPGTDLSSGRRFALRTFGWIRVYKVVRMFGSLEERAHSELVRLTLQGLQMLLFFLWLNHVIGCAWYSIGINAPSDTGGRWTDTLMQDIPGYNDQAAVYRYCTSFHWAMGQITSGGVENISAVNSAERAFSLVIGLFGLFIFSSIISIFNATMIQWQMMQQEQTDKMRALRGYLVQNRVSQRTSMHVQRQVAERMRRRGRLGEKDVHALRLLSFKLKADLLFEVSGPSLMKHPIFRTCALAHLHTVKRACGEAVGTVLKMPGDALFKEKKPSLQAYYVVAGCLSYTIGASSMLVQDDSIERVGVGSWVCEAAIWTKWRHVGSAEAAENAELAAIKVSRLLEELLKQEDIAIIIRSYAIEFHQRLAHASDDFQVRGHLEKWPTDVRVPGTDFIEVVLSMDPEVQMMLGTLTLLDAGNHHAVPPEVLEKLQMELDNQKCAIMMDDQGELFRALSVAVLNLENSEAEVLVHVGKWDDGRLTPQCRLPGAKKSHRETPKAAVEQLLEHISPLVGSSHLTWNELKEECRPSHTVGVSTRYLRHIHHAVVDRPPEQRPPEVPCIDQGSPPRYSIFWLPQQGAKRNSFDLFAWIPRDSLDDLMESKAATEVSGAWLRLLDLTSLLYDSHDFAAKERGQAGDADYCSHLTLQSDGRVERTDQRSNGHGQGSAKALASSKVGVTVTVVGAQRVVGEDVGHLPRAYCKVLVPGKPGVEAKTPVAELSSEPEWDCPFSLATATLGDVLEFEVYDALREGRAHAHGGEEVGLLGRAVLRLDADWQGETCPGPLPETRLNLEGGLKGGGVLVVRVSPLDLAVADGEELHCKALALQSAAGPPHWMGQPDSMAPPSSPKRSSRWEVQGWAVPDTPRPSRFPGCRSSPRPWRGEPELRIPRAESREDPEDAEERGRWRKSLAFYARASAAAG